jgi:hypothetical protein
VFDRQKLGAKRRLIASERLRGLCGLQLMALLMNEGVCAFRQLRER